MRGLILDCLGGDYTIESNGETYTCKAKGIFRKKELSPMAGDTCEFDEGVISEISPRKNSIIRPPLANLDIIFFVVSTCEPSPQPLLLDEFIAVSIFKGIEPVIVLTKNDLAVNEEIPDIYRRIGIEFFIADYTDPQSVEGIKDKIKGRICAFTGNSGVGKTTLLNFLAPELDLHTAQISHKLGRGRHTTRVSRIYPLFGGYIADTPGFSTFSTMQYAVIRPAELAGCFPEFEEYIGNCRFTDCSHTKEQGCAVLEALENGDISRSRHSSYVKMYEEAKGIKEWEIKKK